MFPTKSLCFARSPKRSVTTPPSNTATRVSSRATVIAISIPIPTPSIQQNRRTDVQDERGESPGSGLHPTARRLDGLHHNIKPCASVPIYARPCDDPLTKRNSIDDV